MLKWTSWKKTRKKNKRSNYSQTLKRIKSPIIVVENKSCVSRFQPPVRLKLNFVTYDFKFSSLCWKMCMFSSFQMTYTQECQIMLRSIQTCFEKPQTLNNIRWSTVLPEFNIRKSSQSVIKYQILQKKKKKRHMMNKWSTSSSMTQPSIVVDRY